MDYIYNSSHGHFEVFTTVFSPKVCRNSRTKPNYGQKERRDEMAAGLNYTPHWPDELELCQGDVIPVLIRDDEMRWFGRQQNGQQGYFPPTCVTKQNSQLHSDLTWRVSFANTEGYRTGKRRPSIFDKAQPSALVSSSLKLGTAQEPATDGPAHSKGMYPKSQLCRKVGCGLDLGPEASLPLTASISHSSPGLLRRIRLKQKEKEEYQGATNAAFEPD
ncbi:vexin isoform X2 [Lepisosteus oculatus]|uniref:vexin isoform X2 n=1 Tax=Lepisosteus oculatus TaxID=7918 RepID=UPI00073FCD93|nr:PREDICTED: uncharacterized protein C8orf46 homolog isoform X2 [Lepisosteus oculatus]